jgi:hypothetical protein
MKVLQISKLELAAGPLQKFRPRNNLHLLRAPTPHTVVPQLCSAT